MDNRSFTLGLGIGIIFSVVIVWIVYGVSDFGVSELSKEEIEQKARDYGMEYVSEELWKEETSEATSNQPAKYEAETAEVITYVNDENEDEDITEASADLKEPVSEEEEVVSEKRESDDKFAEITIKAGNNARKVCKMLAESGVIEDAFEYEQYLVKNKKTSELRTGTYKIPKEIDFEDLTNIISKKPK